MIVVLVGITIAAFDTISGIPWVWANDVTLSVASIIGLIIIVPIIIAVIRSIRVSVRIRIVMSTFRVVTIMPVVIPFVVIGAISVMMSLARVVMDALVVIVIIADAEPRYINVNTTSGMSRAGRYKDSCA